MTTTPNLGLPYIDAAQAQKNVTHNEAIRSLDALVQTAIVTRATATPPAAPANGACYILPTAGVGAWAGATAGTVAGWQDGIWVFYPPKTGWLAWIIDEGTTVNWTGTAWQAVSMPSSLPELGVNATADPTNKLSVSSSAVLLNNIGNGVQLKLNKHAATDTASVLFQDNFSGRAEFGLTGDDGFHVKVSPDGSAWRELVHIDPSSGVVSFPSGTAGLAATTMPPATTATIGGIIIGANLTVGGDGTVSAPTPITSLPYSAITGAPTIPAAQVNSDWNATSGLAQILNKPTIPAAYSLPTASASTLGGVLVGANLSITAGILAAAVGLGANTFAAAQTLPAGTNTAPALTFANATSGKTGLFSANADDIAFASNGVRVLWHQNAHTNLGIGANSLAGLTSGTGAYNIALGYYSMGFANVSGSYNIAAGFEALANSSSTSYQVAVGGYALAAISTSAYQHVAIGWQAGTALTNSAVNNVLIGHQAGKSLTTGGNNVVIGASSALTTSLKASQCIAIGNSVLTAYNDGDTTYNCNSVAIGFGAMASLTNGYENVAVGTSILTSATSSYWCTGLGIQALQNTTTGARLTGIGLSALSLATTSTGATAIGMNAGIGGGNSTYAVTTASYGTYLGYQAGPSTATQRDYQTAVGANALGFDAANTVTLGRIGTDTVYMGAAIIGASAVSGVGYTVATLPVAATALKGARAFVTDATSTSWLGSLTGGGSIACPVFCNGSAWVAG